MEKSINKHCKGCTINAERSPDDCCVDKSNENGDCPCSDCIIKMICDIECNTFREYQDKILLENLGD
jgi:hypothetical protein